MENVQNLYHASLLHLLAQTKSFCDAFILAKAAAETYDPQSEQTSDEMAEKTAIAITQMLCEQMAVIPGMRHIFENVSLSFRSPS
jgi:hypothetical protein